MNQMESIRKWSILVCGKVRVIFLIPGIACDCED